MRAGIQLFTVTGIALVMATSTGAQAGQDTPQPTATRAPIRIGGRPAPIQTATPTPTPTRAPMRIIRVTPSPAASPSPAQPIRIIRTVPTPAASPTPAQPIRIGRPTPTPMVSPAPIRDPIRIGRGAPTPTPTVSPTRDPISIGRPAPVLTPGPVRGGQGRQVSKRVGALGFNASTVRPIKAPPGAVTLQAVNYQDAVKAVRVIKPFSYAQIQASKAITLGPAKINLQPLLERKGALPLIAKKLQATPNIGRVNVTNVDVSLVADANDTKNTPKGLVIGTKLNFRLAPGACSDSRRSQVEAIGIRCNKKIPKDTFSFASRFADKGDPHYEPNATKRKALVDKALADTKIQIVEMNANVAEFRAATSDPATRKAIEAEIGAAQLNKMLAMSDEDLAGEVMNSGEQEITQTLYVPLINLVGTTNYNAVLAAIAAMTPVPPPPLPKPQKVSTNTPVTPVIYLTGFTLGRRYEWSTGVETSIDWCWVGCTKHYYVRANAWFEYGFGLRFPIQVGGNYHFESNNGSETASFTPDFVPINGGPNEYLAAGLPQPKLFSGKELVAQAGVGAGFSAHIPVYPDPPPLSFELSKDFTELLPEPFKGGQITPPMPGGAPLVGNFIFEDFDILGGRLNFGILGAQVFPMIEISVSSNSLEFDFTDETPGGFKGKVKRTTPGTMSAVPVKVDSGHSSSFTLANPVYNLVAKLTPGVDPRLFIDLGVWSHNWDFPITFPELAIEIPKGGANFACHEGTTCERNFQFATIGGATGSGAEAVLAGVKTGVEEWSNKFQNDWMPRCSDNSCKITVQQAAAEGVEKMSNWIEGTANPLDKAQMATLKANIEKEKKHSMNVAAMSVTISDIEAWGPKFETKWLPECLDDLCNFAIKLNRTGSVLAMKNQFGSMGDWDAPGIWPPAIIGGAAGNGGTIDTIKKEAETTAATMVKESLVRKSGEQQKAWAQLAKAVWIKKCQDKDCLPEIDRIANKMTPRAKEVAGQHPDFSTNQVVATVGKEFAPQFQDAIDRSGVRAGVDSLSVLTEAAWVKQCADGQCVAQIKSLVAQMLVRARELQKADPDISTFKLNGLVGGEFKPKFQGAVLASEMRKVKMPKVFNGSLNGTGLKPVKPK